MKLSPKDPAKLTPLEVTALRVGDHPVGHGCWLRVRPSGSRSWYVRYRLPGRPNVRYTIGRADGAKAMTLKAARDRAREVLVEVSRGNDPQAEKLSARRQPKTKALTVGQLVRLSIEKIPMRSERTRQNYRLLAEQRIYPKIGSIPAAELEPPTIRLWSDAIAATRPSRANHAFHVVARAFKYGIARGYVKASPFPGMERPAQMSGRERVLSPVELWALHRALDRSHSKGWPHRAGPAVVRLLLLTGARKMEVLASRREEFDLDAVGGAVWTIPAPRMKAGREHVIPLVKEAVELVRARLALTDGPVLFPGWTSRRNRAKAVDRAVNWSPAFVASLRRKMDEELVAAGQPPAEPWVIHDLRRTFATHAREKGGIGLDVISLLLSHSPREGPRVTYTYMRAPLLKERRAALEWWDGGRAVAVDPRTKVVRMEEAKRG